MRPLLLVDDDADVRQILRLWLRHRWMVDEAASGQEALDRCRQHRYAAIVLDQRLPGLSGVETARRLRDQGVDTAVVLFSAFLDPRTTESARELGLTVIAKDELDRLVEALATADDG